MADELNPSRRRSLDGFERGGADVPSSFSTDAARRFYEATDALATRIGVVVEGLERLPSGPALLVANHAFGFDIVFALAAIACRANRRVWVLGEHVWWKIPYLRRFVAAIGVVDGTPENVDRLLAAGELVLVLPGGLREAVKPRELRYRLLWGHRYGFVRAALRHRVPLVPLASVGADELFDFVGNPYQRGARWIGRLDLPIPLPSWILPIPHFSPLRFIVGEPIPPPDGAFDRADESVVRRLRREVEGALHELIDGELARRCGMDPTTSPPTAGG